MMTWFLQFLNNCWSQKQTPQEWKVAAVVPIFKKGDRTISNNYRGISLLNSGYKVYSKITNNRLKNIVHSVLCEEQNGFQR